MTSVSRSTPIAQCIYLMAEWLKTGSRPKEVVNANAFARSSLRLPNASAQSRLYRSRIACLTLGIGSNAAVFSWIEGILIRPYPLVSHQDRMFALVGTTRGVEGHNGLSYPDFVDFEKNATLFESFIVDKITGT